MSRSIPLDAAATQLAELVASLSPGEALELTTAGRPVAVITRPVSGPWPCEPGSASGRTFWMAPDFDAPLDDFADYMK